MKKIKAMIQTLKDRAGTTAEISRGNLLVIIISSCLLGGFWSTGLILHNVAAVAACLFCFGILFTATSLVRVTEQNVKQQKEELAELRGDNITI